MRTSQGFRLPSLAGTCVAYLPCRPGRPLCGQHAHHSTLGVRNEQHAYGGAGWEESSGDSVLDTAVGAGNEVAELTAINKFKGSGADAGGPALPSAVWNGGCASRTVRERVDAGPGG
ncbi:hypothetical protein BJX68DRAFT_99061 [Aspergillus pseudodeflectus]|uniref:Uncharacterized protein n=1 Tax=Aspergillus pseudodeflectus TaxID=176178 RepID=A0ABR4K9X6_9EURO